MGNTVKLQEKMEKKILEYVNSKGYSGITNVELFATLTDYTFNAVEFYDLLEDMVKDYKLLRTNKGRYISPRTRNLFAGKLISNKKGFGFIESDLDYEKDLYIPSDGMNGAIHCDRVVAEIFEKDGKQYGVIKNIIKREIKNIVGTLEHHGTFGFVIPDDKKISCDIFIPKKHLGDIPNNYKVLCEIKKWINGDKNPEGYITEVIGPKGDRFSEIQSVILTHNLPEDFPQNVLQEAEMLPDSVSQEEIDERLDLRNEKIFTIDGADAKDLDDAVSIKVNEKGNFILGVHIADVTHYVREKGKLDKEALKRATSVYLVDKVIPMLPEKLSNGICSLHPNTDKLTLSVIMEINHKGDVVDYDIKESVINTCARMTYTEVSDILENKDEQLIKQYNEIVDQFFIAEELMMILRNKRERRGMIDLDIPETQVFLDPNNSANVLDIKPHERRVANKLIEEFMIVTNETVSSHFFWLEIPFVYRVHEVPDGEKMTKFNNFIETFGYSVKGDLENVHPKTLQKILNNVKDKPESKAISTIMLRSLKHARYTPEALGHFGLASEYYSHFTSPIRRYPDLQIHRIIKEYLHGKLSVNRNKKLGDIVEYSSEQSSKRERVAEVAERDVKSIYKCLYMEKFIGEDFEGVISNITSFGMFIELDNTVEGLVKTENIPDDYWEFDEITMSLIGVKNGKVFKIGDKVKVQVESINMEMKEVNFKLL